ncbi:hypothetical protein D9M70_452280 [compost metagenome]
MREAPSSITALSCSAPSSRRVRGTPRSLFKLPRVASTLPWVRRMLASISLTVVLPLEPVTAATRPLNRSRLQAPRRPRPSRVSATTSCGMGASATLRCTRAATAPLEATSER